MLGSTHIWFTRLPWVLEANIAREVALGSSINPSKSPLNEHISQSYPIIFFSGIHYASQKNVQSVIVNDNQLVGILWVSRHILTFFFGIKPIFTFIRKYVATALKFHSIRAVCNGSYYLASTEKTQSVYGTALRLYLFIEQLSIQQLV